ncbi:hypothetical protein L1887_32220 [Cichorium endivia]|nr:hypothetical protein L1887_32220 [Cichorium endivia]
MDFLGSVLGNRNTRDVATRRSEKNAQVRQSLEDKTPVIVSSCRSSSRRAERWSGEAVSTPVVAIFSG